MRCAFYLRKKSSSKSAFFPQKVSSLLKVEVEIL